MSKYRASKTKISWAGLWRSKNVLGGETIHFLYEDGKPIIFPTRKVACEYIKKYFGYIKNRQDLRGEPHGWKMPIPVRVKITIETI